MKVKKRFSFFNAAPLQSFITGWLLALVFWLIVLPGSDDAPSLVINVIFMLATFICGGFAAICLKPLSGNKKRTWLKETGFSIILTIGLVAVTFLTLLISGHWSLLTQSEYGEYSTIITLLLCAPGYLVARIVITGLRAWDELRKRRYMWGMVHSILAVVAIIGVLAILIFFFTIYIPNVKSLVPVDTKYTQIILWGMTALVLTGSLVLAGLLLLFPLSFFVSYIIARQTTRRVELLSQAVNDLQNGNLDTRIQVKVRDEIAQLQDNFNKMAVDLQKSTNALKKEKDKVTALLQNQYELTASVSHELRTPITIILGYLEEMRGHWQDFNDDEIHQKIRAISDESIRMRIILNDLLTIAQYETNHLSLNLQSVNCKEIIGSVVERLRVLSWDQRRIQITFKHPATPLKTTVDPLRLEQVLINLIQNGVKNSPPGSLVSVTLSEHDSYMLIEIADSGEGIAQEDLPHIWEKFYQSSASQNKTDKVLSEYESQKNLKSSFTEKGFGLGLSVVKELVEGFGGKISCESSVGEGCVFQILLPISS